MRIRQLASALVLSGFLLRGVAAGQQPAPSVSVELDRPANEQTPAPAPPPPAPPVSPSESLPPAVQGSPLRPQLDMPGIWGGATGAIADGPWVPPPPRLNPLNPATADTPAYAGIEYLLWAIKGDPVPVLVTTSPPASAGILGQPGTTVLFGGQGIGSGPYSGLRATVGYWVGSDRMTAVEVSGFLLAERTESFGTSSATFPVIARPFFNANTQSEFSELVASPGAATGNINVSAPSQIWGIEANVRRTLCCEPCYRFGVIGGFRYLDLSESLRIQESLLAAPGVLGPTAVQGVAIDSFHTRNQFYGAQAGVQGECQWGHWFVNMTTEVALGSVNETVNIVGAQQLTPIGGAPQVFSGGLLALNSNSGNFTHSNFAVVPEFGTNFGYQITSYCRVFCGYTFLYISSVLRPGDQVDRSLNVTQIPNFAFPNPPAAPLHPIVPFETSDFWAQGLNVGVAFRY